MVFKPALVVLIASAGLGAAFTAEPHISPAAARVAPARVQRVARPLHTPRIRLGSGTSTNWCGYAADGSNVTDVKGTWTVPGIIPGGCANSYSAAWVGIDGDNSNTVEQCGTEQDSSGQYYAWYEMYPKGSAYVGPVSRGDTITAEVHYEGGGNFRLTMIRNNNYTQPILNIVQKLAQARRTSAEWIMEAPWSGGVLPLAEFGTMSFSGCSSTGSTGGVQPIRMANSSGQTKADVSSFWNGGSFSVSWFQCQ